MSSSFRVMGNNSKPLFSVFSDENATYSTSRSSSASTVKSSSSSLPIPSKRIKMAPLLDKKPVAGLYAASTKTGLPMPNTSTSRPRTALSVKQITVYQDDKENVDPSGKRKPSAKDKEKSKNSATSKTDLWKGKQPFDFASPEKEDIHTAKSKANVSSRHIYDLPGIQATSHVTSSSSSSSASNNKEVKPSLRTVGGASAISRPNKKTRPVPALLKRHGTFETFKDDVAHEEVFVAPRAIASSSTASARKTATIAVPTPRLETAMRSPVSMVQDSDRRARELTESPLAEVTLAYTGRGRFSNSPTGDSGFGSRETSVSPLPSARLSGPSNSSQLAVSPLQAYQELPELLPEALQSLSISSSLTKPASAMDTKPSKRRISQLSSSISRSAGAWTSSTTCESVEEMRHIDQRNNAVLDDFAMQHFGDQSYATDEDTEEEEEDDNNTLHAAQVPQKAVSVVTKTAFNPVQSSVRPPSVQSRFGQRTSAPARKPLNLRV